MKGVVAKRFPNKVRTVLISKTFSNTTSTTTSQSLPFSAPSFKLLLLKSHESSETNQGICVSSVNVFTIKDKISDLLHHL